MRSIGSQFFASIFLFVAFYVIGLPIGISLLLKSSLKLKGYFLGMSLGLVVLVILQCIYIFRLNWDKMAEKAFSSTKTTVPLEIREFSSKADLTTDIISSGNLNEKSDTPKVRTSLKIQILKRLLVLSIFVAIFLASIIARCFVKLQIEMDSEPVTFSNSSGNNSTVNLI